MKNYEQTLLPFNSPDEKVNGKGWLGLQIDHRQFLDAMQDEWLLPRPGETGRILSTGSYAEQAYEPRSANSINVRLRFDPSRLPRLTVPVQLGGTWERAPIDALPSKVGLTFWPGAIPLFAVTKITVTSAEERARLLGLSRQASNISTPLVDVEPGRVEFTQLPLPSDIKSDDRGISLSDHYSLVRGASTMAVWAIPRVDPWLDLLVASLSGDRVRLTDVAKEVATPWHQQVPWLYHTADVRGEPLDIILWMAALLIFRECNRGGIDALVAVERIHDYAVAQSRACSNEADAWRDQTISVLRGKEALRMDDWKRLPVGKALQILLLRPDPESFASWLHDSPAIPPSVWYAASILCGFLHGYRKLPAKFRGTAVQRRTLAIHALNATSDRSSVDWPFPSTEQLKWRRDVEDFLLTCGESEFARISAHPRTLWYLADLTDPDVRRAAEELTRRLKWKCVNRRVTIANNSMRFAPQPESGVRLAGDEIAIQGTITFELPEDSLLSESLEPAAFKECLAVEGVPNIQPPPSKVKATKSSQLPQPTLSHPIIKGLFLVENYLTTQEEAELVAKIDAGAWQDDLKRHVQHYGWRYDYKARQVKREMYLGPLPEWASKLANRMSKDGLLPHVPDQVIVNEYIGKQGISKHVDCKPCFEDGIAMISLLQSWEMIFSRAHCESEGILLPRRSVVVITGEARYLWSHEIPKRASEPNGERRDRRISITFRKVTVADESGQSTKKPRSRRLN